MPKNNWTIRSKHKTVKRAQRRVKPTNNTKKDLGRWKAIDDYLLIQGVQQTDDLQMVHRGTKFSCRFTLQEIETRWVLLMYNETISGLAIDSMRKLHPELIEKAERNALFSSEEENLLMTITDLFPFVEHFEGLLAEHKHIFHPSRTAKDLYEHFQLLKSYDLLPCQTVEPLTSADQLMSFSDAELQINDHDLDNTEDTPLMTEVSSSNRRDMREMRQLETELDRWSLLVTSITTNNDIPLVYPEMDNQTLAVLRGRTVKFIMKSNDITFGRNTKDNIVDIDLSLEGSADKISRKQGTIKLRTNGDFFLANDGKRTIFVDGEPILQNHKCKLRNLSLVEIGDLSFVFLINDELVNAIRQENGKMDTPLIELKTENDEINY